MRIRRSLVFASIAEWIVCATFAIMFSLVGSTANDVLVCNFSLVVLALAGFAHASVARRSGDLRNAWWAGGLVIAAVGILIFIKMGASLFLIMYPILGALYLHRLTRFRTELEPEEVMAKWFRVESFVVPFFVLACVELPASPFLSRSLWIPLAFAAFATRVFSMACLSRTGNEKSLSRTLQEMMRIGGVALVAIGLAFLAPYAVYLSVVFYPVLLLEIKTQSVRRGTPPQEPPGTSVTRNKDTIPPQHALTPHVPHWAYFAIGVAVACFVVWVWIRKRVEDETDPQKGVSLIIERERWVPQDLRFGETSSFVRRQYQKLIRLMAKRNIEFQGRETAREYALRIENLSGNPSLKGAARIVSDAYELVRYQTDERETPDLRERIDMAMRSIEQALKESERK